MIRICDNGQVLVLYAAYELIRIQRDYHATGQARCGDTPRDETTWSPEVHDFD